MIHTTPSSALWRRLDSPGHDACRLIRDAQGWEMAGTAVFLHEGRPAQLAYQLAGDPTWRTQRGAVKGFLADTIVDVVVTRSADGAWTFNGARVPGFEAYEHLDFAFTPATNLPHLSQLALGENQAADLPVVWLDLPCNELELLPQRYARRTASMFWYEAPSVGYSALLEVAATGFVRRYPGLWELEA
jgi:hypothetical protein